MSSVSGTQNYNALNSGTSITAEYKKGENVRVFPISNWTELDVWSYIQQEKIELPSIYFAHNREVIEHEGRLIAVRLLSK